MLCGVALTFGQARAQKSVAESASLVGTVLADGTERPLASAEVAMPALSRVVRSDSAGNFHIDNIAPGKYVVLVRLIGYAPFATELVFAPRERVERDFLLIVRPVRLAEVDVNAAKPERGKMSEFERRRKAGLGTFITREVFEKNANHRTGDILAAQAMGLEMLRIGGGKEAVASNRGRSTFKALPYGDDADRRLGAKRACYAQVFVDGSLVYIPEPDRPLFDVNSIPPDQIEAIEFFAGGAQSPPELNPLGATCGTLVIWTRVGGK